MAVTWYHGDIDDNHFDVVHAYLTDPIASKHCKKQCRQHLTFALSVAQYTVRRRCAVSHLCQCTFAAS